MPRRSQASPSLEWRSGAQVPLERSRKTFEADVESPTHPLRGWVEEPKELVNWFETFTPEGNSQEVTKTDVLKLARLVRTYELADEQLYLGQVMLEEDEVENKARAFDAADSAVHDQPFGQRKDKRKARRKARKAWKNAKKSLRLVEGERTARGVHSEWHLEVGRGQGFAHMKPLPGSASDREGASAFLELPRAIRTAAGYRAKTLGIHSHTQVLTENKTKAPSEADRETVTEKIPGYIISRSGEVLQFHADGSTTPIGKIGAIDQKDLDAAILELIGAAEWMKQIRAKQATLRANRHR